jgi:hypothetical protein
VASLSRLDTTDTRIACLSYLEPGGFTNARYLVRRLRRKLPRARIVVGFWTLSEEDATRRDALGQTGADLIVTSLRQAADYVVTAARETAHRLETSARRGVVQALSAAQ